MRSVCSVQLAGRRDCRDQTLPLPNIPTLGTFNSAPHGPIALRGWERVVSAGRRREEAQTGVAVGGCVQQQEEYLLRDAPPFLMRGAAWKHHGPANHGAAEAGN